MAHSKLFQNENGKWVKFAVERRQEKHPSNWEKEWDKNVKILFSCDSTLFRFISVISYSFSVIYFIFLVSQQLCLHSNCVWWLTQENQMLKKIKTNLADSGDKKPFSIIIEISLFVCRSVSSTFRYFEKWHNTELQSVHTFASHNDAWTNPSSHIRSYQFR